jgi:hypothetical protein
MYSGSERTPSGIRRLRVGLAEAHALNAPREGLGGVLDEVEGDRRFPRGMAVR